MSDIDENHHYGRQRSPVTALHAGLMNIIREVGVNRPSFTPARIRLRSTGTGERANRLHTPGKCWPVTMKGASAISISLKKQKNKMPTPTLVEHLPKAEWVAFRLEIQSLCPDR